MLSDEQIHDFFQQSSRDKTKERRLIARAIEAEVRKQDTELIRQIVQAVDGIRLVASYSTYGAPNWSDLDEVFAAARARLENT